LTTVEGYVFQGLHSVPRIASKTSKFNNIVSEPTDVASASLEVLSEYDADYLRRMRNGRKEGKTPYQVELEHAQTLQADGIQEQREQLRSAVSVVVFESSETCLGIMAKSGEKAIEVLRSWIGGLELPRGLLTAVDETGVAMDVNDLMNTPVYIKYNSTMGGDAYMKPYKDDGFAGVIFQPKMDDDEFRQYGNLPLKLF
jgi:hypothetical protein